ncbi:MAG TPA: GNAT family N-acetyltransferase [Blastocatellia bacterium]|nr:GNAT family N-acetyltransferase [Blastocatellia bacterium]
MSTDSLNIRLAERADRDALFGLMHELGYRSLSQSEFDEVFNEVLSRGDTWVLVAEEAGRVLGLASMSERPQLRLGGPIVTIDEFVVRSDVRGKGVGRLLLESAKEYARQRGGRRLQLDTNRSRESYSRSFYLKNGFAEADSAVLRLELTKK